jgi:DNA-binding transcriptional regulator YdaS (Cro superfamily)
LTTITDSVILAHQLSVAVKQMTLSEWLDIEDGKAKDLAREIGLHPVQISQWKTGARQVPAEHCPTIERATGGAVRCEDLRPDVDWAYLRGTPHVLEAA